jgi:hypothetical protein
MDMIKKPPQKHDKDKKTYGLIRQLRIRPVFSYENPPTTKYELDSENPQVQHHSAEGRAGCMSENRRAAHEKRRAGVRGTKRRSGEVHSRKNRRQKI